MLMIFSAKEISRFSPSTRRELMQFAFPTPYPAGFSEGDFRNVADLNVKQVQDFIAGCAPSTVAGLKMFAEHGPCINARLLSDAGVDNFARFQGGVTKRTRTITGDENSYLFAWDDWETAEDGIGHYSVSETTYQSLREYFELD